MSEDDPIYADAGQPATLHYAGKAMQCLTLQEAVIAWRNLSLKDQEEATIRVSGAVYTANEIQRLHYARSP